MKRHFYFLSVFTALFFTTACEKSFVENPVQEENIQEGVVEYTSRLVSATLVSSTPASEAAAEAIRNLPKEASKLVDTLSTDIYNAFNSEYFGVDWAVEVYTISFKTVDAYDKPLVLSGDIAFLNEKTGNIERELESAYVFNNMFACDDAKGGFLASSAMVLRTVILPIRALFNELVIYPHNQGAGMDKGIHFFTPTEYILNARQNIDLELAALEFIKEKGVNMSPDYYTQVVGISNGAASALAFQYLLEGKNDPKTKEVSEKIRLNGTYCAEGCYYPSEVFINLMKNRMSLNESGMYVKMPYIYVSVVCGAFDSWKKEFEGKPNENKVLLTDFFSEEFNSFLVDTDGDGEGDTPVLDVYKAGEFDFNKAEKMTEWGFSIENIINDDLYDDEGVLNEESAPVKALKKALRHNESFVSGWTPVSPLLITHSQADEMNPYSEAYSIYNNLSNSGHNKNVNFRTVYLLDHQVSCPVFLIESLFKRNAALGE